ncbi:Potassium channel subfamily K member 18, partial [Frankliniella fusca]
MLYALVGVPLMLLCLSNLGSFLADTFQFAYSHACCKPCRGGGGGGSKKQMQQEMQQQQQQQMAGYSGGSVSLGPPGSIACPPGPPPPAASTLPRVAKAARDRDPCAPSFGYFSGPVDWSVAGEQAGFFQDREREQQLHGPVHGPVHSTVVKQTDNKVVTRLHHPPHITPDVHRLLTECIEYQVMHEEPGAAAALRELQRNPPAPACAACSACSACAACPAQQHDGSLSLGALEEEPEDDDDDEDHHGDR